MLGLCLPGGGAKGAFSAGVIYGLYESGIHFDIISGTSIGAINSYFIYKNNMEKMKEIWTTINEDEFNKEKCLNNIIDNSKFINMLREVDGINKDIKNFYVNYVNIKNKKLKEIVIDIANLEKDEILKYVKYSALLPYRSKNEVYMKDVLEKFDSKVVFDNFKEDIETGIYEDYNLDGGILNNNLLSPFMENKVNKLFIIPLRKNYIIPEYILEHYKKEDIILIEPNREMHPNDTLRFEKEFCKELFFEGYEKGKNLNLKERI